MVQKNLVKKLVLFTLTFFLTTPLLGLSKRSADKDRHNASTVRPANIVMDIAGIPAGDGQLYIKTFVAASIIKSLVEHKAQGWFKDPDFGCNAQRNSIYYDDRYERARTKIMPMKYRAALQAAESAASFISFGVLTGKKNPFSIFGAIPGLLERYFFYIETMPLGLFRTSVEPQLYMVGYIMYNLGSPIIKPLLKTISSIKQAYLIRKVKRTISASDWHHGMRAPRDFAHNEYIILDSPSGIFLSELFKSLNVMFTNTHNNITNKAGFYTLVWLASSRYYIKKSALKQLDEKTQKHIFNIVNWKAAKQISRLALSPANFDSRIEEEAGTFFSHSCREAQILNPDDPSSPLSFGWNALRNATESSEASTPIERLKKESLNAFSAMTNAILSLLGTNPEQYQLDQETQDDIKWFYQQAKLSKDATDQQVTKGYHNLARNWHPDKVAQRGLLKKKAEEAAINYEKLEKAYTGIKRLRGIA